MSTLIGMGITTAACLVLPLLLGWAVDGASDMFPIWTLVGIALGIATASAYVIAKFRQYLR